MRKIIRQISRHLSVGYLVCLSSLILTFNLLPLSFLHSVPHINGKDPGPKEYVRQIPDIKMLQKAGLSPQLIERTIGTTGTRKIAVILVNFSDAGSNTSGYPTMDSTDIAGFNNTFDYLKNFYKEASYGKLDLDITFFHSTGSVTSLSGNETPFILTTPMSSYGADTDTSLSQLL
ncbi:MAG: hypothetical protein Q7K21_02600, partial [Elusimicrobiota bacterium]|nr:hypothetical protein [Elusimicrobiota bacterium]